MMKANPLLGCHICFPLPAFRQPWVWQSLSSELCVRLLFIVLNIGSQNIPQMMHNHDDDVIETFATNRADDALYVNILPRLLPCGYDFLNP